MTNWFNNKCLCNAEMYCHLVCGDDEVFWCEKCGRIVIVYRGYQPTPEDWYTPKLIKGDFIDNWDGGATSTEKYETEREHSYFLEGLLKALYGKGWENLCRLDAEKWHKKYFKEE